MQTFTNLVDLIQVFANEYCSPGNLVLVYGNIDEFELICKLFEFINSNVISVDTTPGKNVDIAVKETLPFESQSFDLIISCKDIHPECKRILKPNGKLLIKDNTCTPLETYKLHNEIFSVL